MLAAKRPWFVKRQLMAPGNSTRSWCAARAHPRGGLVQGKVPKRSGTPITICNRIQKVNETTFSFQVSLVIFSFFFCMGVKFHDIL